MTDRLWDETEAAAFLHVERGWLAAQRRAGHVPHKMLGKYPRYDEADLRAWVESLTEGGGPRWRSHRPQVAENGGQN